MDQSIVKYEKIDDEDSEQQFNHTFAISNIKSEKMLQEDINSFGSDDNDHLQRKMICQSVYIKQENIDSEPEISDIVSDQSKTIEPDCLRSIEFVEIPYIKVEGVGKDSYEMSSFNAVSDPFKVSEGK